MLVLVLVEIPSLLSEQEETRSQEEELEEEGCFLLEWRACSLEDHQEEERCHR